MIKKKRKPYPSHLKIKVAQVDPVTEYTIAEFESICEAERSTGVSKGTIAKALTKLNYRAGGYQWVMIYGDYK
jgi:hypothetical protein